ncbi:MAG TPA: TIGR02281 family clan AA aspartic protease [Gammaproteobacteria bacterium]|nr:TIGR02281 family clan AA aspartic protease [Gammaproteobacteria bacterium]
MAMLKPAYLLLFLVILSGSILAGMSTSQAADRIIVQALFNNMAVVNINGKRITLIKGKPVQQGLRLLGANSREAVIEHHGQVRTYKMSGQPVRSRYPDVAKTAEIKIWPDKNGLYITSGLVNGVTTEFLVDTGASVIAMNEEHARNFGIDYKKTGKPIDVETASGKLTGSVLKLNSIQVGGIVINNVMAVVLPGKHPTRVLLGATFLSKVDLQRKDTVILLKARPY